ncbi:hypothetical protein ACFRFU_02960 [Streptomyces sp. NPDC056704]
MLALLCDVDAVLGPAAPGVAPKGLGHRDRLEGLFSLGHAVEQAARANG